MFCEICGQKLYDEDLYCGNCGAKVNYNRETRKPTAFRAEEAAVPIMEAAEIPIMEEAKMPLKKKGVNKKIILIPIIIVVLIVAVVAKGKISDYMMTSNLEKNIVATWCASNSDASIGLYNFYIYNSDHTYDIEGYVKGEKLHRYGEWEVKDDSIIMHPTDNVTGSITVGGIEYNPTNDDITITMTDENNIVADGNSQFVKITEEEYKQDIKNSESMAPKKLTVGKTVKNKICSIKVKSFGWKDRIYPSDTSDYYTYYDKNSGESYLVAKVKIKNLANDYIGLCSSSKAYFTLDGKNFDASVEMDDGNRFSSIYTLNPEESDTFIIYASISESLKKSDDITLHWSVPNDLSSAEAYYSSASSCDDFELTLE